MKPDVKDPLPAPEVLGGGLAQAREDRDGQGCEPVTEDKTESLQYRFDGPEHLPILILGPSLGTTWHRL
ncbi:hypothetical protein P8A18_29035 [Streptomyces castrisilvae]|uniref:Alpha/beta hydrolase n=1 Tax=Streptomyces castrisilvae TaxID=3033811 RepID=A0ABY9HUW9_9ACTN|nr:hypothetical protein [Streptomyces sp. Mut1]WLQ38362.1 hypothetical protein P8A18_29035 [Streptomyces sp. Mut1]